MDFARLRTLRELSLRKTMAAVAEALLISPSAVSQQIAQLEDETGVELVERRGRGVRLTPAGQRLADHAGRVIGVLEEAKTDLAELKKTVAGELRVSAFPSVAASLIPPTIRAMSARFPDLVTIFEELEPDDSLAALRAWQTDVAIVDDLTTSASLSETQVEMLHLLDDHLHVLLPRDHPLAERPSPHLAGIGDRAMGPRYDVRHLFGRDRRCLPQCRLRSHRQCPLPQFRSGARDGRGGLLGVDQSGATRARSYRHVAPQGDQADHHTADIRGVSHGGEGVTRRSPNS